MALPLRMDWEVQQGGNDLNGGGFMYGGAGTDYSQQPVAQLIDPAIASLGIGSVQLQSPTGGFTAAMVDNIIQLSTGTNLIPSWFRIVTYIDPNNITVDRAPDDGVGPLIGDTVGHVGGALATPGQLTNVINRSTSTTYGNLTHRAWIGQGAYMTTTPTPGSGGPFSQVDTNGFFMEGYGAVRGDMTPGAVVFVNGVPGAGTVSMIHTLAARNQQMAMIINIEVDGAGDPLCNGIYHLSRGGSMRCKVYNCPGGIGIRGNMNWECESHDNFVGIQQGFSHACVAHDNGDDGFQNSGAKYCVSYGNGGRGFDGFLAEDVFNCIAYNNALDGFYCAISNSPQAVTDSISVNNGGYGYRMNSGQVVWNSAGYGNVSGLIQNHPLNRIPPAAHANWYIRHAMPSDPITAQALIALTGDPFVDAPNADFRLNNVAGAGAACRNAGSAIPGQQAERKSLGAMEFVASGGGSTPIRRTARRLG